MDKWLVLISYFYVGRKFENEYLNMHPIRSKEMEHLGTRNIE